MHQKTRYNIRLAERKDVIVRARGSDLPAFNALMQTTGARDEFGAHAPDYYARAYDLFRPDGDCELLVAEFEGRPGGADGLRPGLARLVLLRRVERRRAQPHAHLPACSGRRCAGQRRRGCRHYDLWGVPDDDEATLEAQF